MWGALKILLISKNAQMSWAAFFWRWHNLHKDYYVIQKIYKVCSVLFYDGLIDTLRVHRLQVLRVMHEEQKKRCQA